MDTNKHGWEARLSGGTWRKVLWCLVVVLAAVMATGLGAAVGVIVAFCVHR